MLRADVGNGWFEKIKETLHLDSVLAGLDLSSYSVMYASLYSFFGFVVGFGLKKYGRYLIILSLFCGLVLFGLYCFNVITFDILKLKELIGLAPTTTFNNFLQLFYEWMRDNKIISISSIVGFIIGYMVG